MKEYHEKEFLIEDYKLLPIKRTYIVIQGNIENVPTSCVSSWALSSALYSSLSLPFSSKNVSLHLESHLPELDSARRFQR